MRESAGRARAAGVRLEQWSREGRFAQAIAPVTQDMATQSCGHATLPLPARRTTTAGPKLPAVPPAAGREGCQTDEPIPASSV